MVREVTSTAKVLDLSGKVVKEISLPPVFLEEYRPDLIKRAVLALQSNRFQPKGTDPLAGRRTSAESWGPGRGVARVPRVTDGRRAARAPQTVGGRRAHPPKPEKRLERKINKKERRKAIRSAIAATTDPLKVRERGHRFSENLPLPLIVEDSLAGLAKTAEVEAVFKTLGVWDDVLRAKVRKVRAGKGKMRGRRYKTKKSLLIVIGREDAQAEERPILKAAKNLPGVDIAYAPELNTELLAPGTHPGRLTIWTESSLAHLTAME
ncbi:MAG: 50S ribosomal protein L4 [Candidatus Methanospirareceae archaeon]